MRGLPTKLSHDAIVEALIEVRFNTSLEPEVFLGKVLSLPEIGTYRRQRLPAANIPNPIRQSDNTLRFQPTFEFISHDTQKIIRLGPQVFSLHMVNGYPGWASFDAQIKEVISKVFLSTDDYTLARLGLRYINFFDEKKHQVKVIGDLSLDIKIGENRITDNVNIHYSKIIDDLIVQVKVATKDFISPPPSANASIFCDIDVSTEYHSRIFSTDFIFDWMERAHNEEKKEFFSLLRPEIIERLRER